ncbi:MAG: Ldh family oxidoreductase [Desulfobaccales bacterium]
MKQDMHSIKLSVRKTKELVQSVLLQCGVDSENAETVADALVFAEASGIESHGVARVPFFAEQVLSGKIKGDVAPVITKNSAPLVLVDAGDGFAFPAIKLGIQEAIKHAAFMGVGIVAVSNSHHFGIAGYHVHKIATHGYLGLATSNTFGAIAPWEGKRPLLGNNPLALAVPRNDKEPVVIDFAPSVVARGRILLAAQRGEDIPQDWALDSKGEATKDPKAALNGSLMAIGGHKGAVLAMLLDLLVGLLTESNFAFEASSVYTPEGPPPRLGQLLIIFNPKKFGVSDWMKRAEYYLTTVLSEPGVRLPGDRASSARQTSKRDGLYIPAELFNNLAARIKLH